MEKSNKFKLFIGLVYLILICLFLFFFFSKFSIQELTSYDFLRENRLYFAELKNSNLLFISIIFLVLTIVWCFPLLGFGSPIALIGGFLFGKFIGTIVVVIGLSVGATFLYIFGNYFLKDFIKEKLLNKYHKLETKFKKSEFTYLLIYRLIGGIPWQISCLLPTLFNVRVRNFFFATLIGIVPQIFLAVSIGSGFEKIVDQNSEVPGITEIIFSPDIYIPLIAFFSLILVTIFLRKIFYKN
jgi:uncharacterized membrane protein YdjX (TVP38/TMEM64 family)